MSAPHRFRLYPEAPRGLYVLAMVHPTLKALRKLLRQHGVDGSEAEGACIGMRIDSYRDDRAPRVVPCCAEVHFWRGALGTSVITHELLHATFAWAARVRVPFHQLETWGARLEGGSASVSDAEERLCYAHGRLCRDFVLRATAAGLYAE